MTYTEALQGILVDFVKQHPNHPIFLGITRNLKKYRKLVHLQPKDIVTIVDNASLAAQHERRETYASGCTMSGIYSALVTVRARADKGEKIDEHSFKIDTPAERKRKKERERKRKQRMEKKFRQAENERRRKRYKEVQSKLNPTKSRRIVTDSEKKAEAKKKKRDYMMNYRITKLCNMTAKERRKAKAKRREDWKNRTPEKKEADNKKKRDARAKRTPEQVEADKANLRKRIAGLRRARMELGLKRK
jgi:hypothetical protein